MDHLGSTQYIGLAIRAKFNGLTNVKCKNDPMAHWFWALKGPLQDKHYIKLFISFFFYSTDISPIHHFTWYIRTYTTYRYVIYVMYQSNTSTRQYRLDTLLHVMYNDIERCMYQDVEGCIRNWDVMYWIILECIRVSPKFRRFL